MQTINGITFKHVREKMGIKLTEIAFLTAIEIELLESYESGEDNISNRNENFVPIYASFLMLLGREKSTDYDELRNSIQRKRFKKGKLFVEQRDSKYLIHFEDVAEFGGRIFKIEEFDSKEAADGFLQGFSFRSMI